MIKCKGDNMDLNRNTYAEINIKNIKNNVEKIIQHYNDYTYYIGVIKADCYGHDGLETVKAIIDGGCNYLAVATLDEALIVRKTFKNIPILCLGPVPSKHIDLCISNNITITINSLEYLKELDKYDLSNIKVHIKLNTGMNRLGISSIDELKTVISILNNKKVFIEGIYTHLYNADNKDIYEKQLNIFKELIDSIDIDNIAASSGKSAGSRAAKAPKKKYGEYKHVLLTAAEYEKLTADYGEDIRDKAIKYLDEYIAEKAYKSKSHYLAIKRWVIDAVTNQEARQYRSGNNGTAYDPGRNRVAEQLDRSYEMMANWASSG